MGFIYNDITALPVSLRGAVLAIGNFDGVHLGHQELLAHVRKIAREKSVPAGVLTFEPHPRQFFQPDGAPFRLTFINAKARKMAAMGMDFVLALDFNADLAALPAADFIALLQRHLSPAHIVVGEGFAFGHGRGGSVETLAATIGAVAVAPLCCPVGAVYSSTRIRVALGGGNLTQAADMLGAPWEIENPVILGDRRGRTIGYPTANVATTGYIRIPHGIYVCEALIDGIEGKVEGVMSYGERPMFRVAEPLLEMHIFDFDQDIYDKTIRVTPLKFLRPEIMFEDIAALAAQIKQDCQAARDWLRSRNGGNDNDKTDEN